jgi:TM2 domain-containing membrane protein YozV
MNRFCLICKFLSVLFLISNESRTQARQMADSLMKGHEYALAAVYYEKALFDQNQQVDTVISENFRLLTNTLLNQKIQCQKALRTFEDAWQTAQRFDLNEPNDTLQFKLRYEGALCGYLSQRYNEAYGQIQQTRFYTRDTTLTASLDVLEILTLNELERWTESKVIFARYVSRNRLTIQVDKLYDFLKKKPKNPDKAQLLSFLMPGLGQIYAGYPKEGLISAGLQALSLGFGVYHVLNKYYLISFFSGAGLFQTFYFGGARRASLMAEETNRKRKARNSQKIRALLVENEQKKER